jgi:hypothetical protein
MASVIRPGRWRPSRYHKSDPVLYTLTALTLGPGARSPLLLEACFVLLLYCWAPSGLMSDPASQALSVGGPPSLLSPPTQLLATLWPDV